MKTKKCVLIVDTDGGLRPSLDQLFAGRQFEATRAASLDQTLALLDAQTFDVVLIHGNREWEAARPVLRWLCTSYPQTVVVVSGLAGDTATAIELLKAGARECVTEEVSMAALVDAVQTALDRHFRAVRPWYDQSVKAIAAAIGLRDVETVEHCQRVAATTVRLCRALGMRDEKHNQAIGWGAYLHDVGKVGLPDSILRKPGPLDHEQLTQMQRHPVDGKALLERIPFLADSIPVVLYHHERFDGHGYPEGLKGESIPLEARAIAVADTVDAMLSNRPYRPPLSWERVVAELVRNQNVQFDPEVVAVALRHQRDVFAVYGLDARAEEVTC